MIKSIETYLITDGNGLEAVEFYEDVFDAKLLNLTSFPNDETRVMNAQLDIDGIRLQLSDENPAYTYTSGLNMSACIIVDSVEDAKRIYNKLIVDAKRIGLELQQTFWSPAYANVVDKYGMQWQISTELPQ